MYQGDEDDMDPYNGPVESSPTDKDDSGEDDSSPLPEEKPQEAAHPNLSVPDKPMAKTAEALRLLGAGQPYMNRNC
jgi:hypothetical protein